jgi:hypothetical protein
VTSVPSKLATIERRVFVPPPAKSSSPALLYINPAAVPSTYWDTGRAVSLRAA